MYVLCGMSRGQKGCVTYMILSFPGKKKDGLEGKESLKEH